MSAMISVEEALKRVLASAKTPLEEEKVALQAAYGRVLAYDLKALRTQPPFPNSAMDGYALRAAMRCRRPRPSHWSANPLRAAPSTASSVRARRCASSLAPPCPMAPTLSSFRRMSSARASKSVCQPRRRQGTICVRPAWTFRPARRSSRLATGWAPETSRWRRRQTTPSLRFAGAPGSRFWRPATNWSRPVGRSARRKSSPPTISPSPA